MPLFLRTSLATLAALLLALPAAGLPLNATEGAVDFPDINSQTRDMGTLDIGVNKVTGSMTGTAGDTADFWDAALPVGMEITSIEILVTNLSGSLWRAIAEDELVSSGRSTVGAWLTTSASGLQSVPATQGAFPFQAAQYHFATVSFDVSDFDYEWRVHVASVPEPGTLALIALGLSGATWPLRRRSRAS
jgi:hypothetical protein